MMSPGPTTVMVLRSGSQGGRRYARATALGVISSTAVHVALGADGLGTLLLPHAALADSLRVAGAVYLSYLGGRILHGLLSGSRTATADAGTNVDGHSWSRTGPWCRPTGLRARARIDARGRPRVASLWSS